MKTLIEYIAKSLVDNPEAVVIHEERHGNAVNLVLKVAKDDMGRVIGKNGRVANAMRILLRVAASRAGQRVTLDVEEPR